MMNSKKDSTITLKLWIFKLLSSEFGVCVEGYRAKDEGEYELLNWRSTPIEERITSTVVVTGTGTKYILRGVIDTDSALALGYPMTIIEQFKEGFPPNWQSILRKYYGTISNANLLSATQWFNTTILGFDVGDRSRRLSSDVRRLSVFSSVSAEAETARCSRGSIGIGGRRSTFGNAHRLAAAERIDEVDEENLKEVTILVDKEDPKPAEPPELVEMATDGAAEELAEMRRILGNSTSNQKEGDQDEGGEGGGPTLMGRKSNARRSSSAVVPAQNGGISPRNIVVQETGKGPTGGVNMTAELEPEVRVSPRASVDATISAPDSGKTSKSGHNEWTKFAGGKKGSPNVLLLDTTNSARDSGKSGENDGTLALGIRKSPRFAPAELDLVTENRKSPSSNDVTEKESPMVEEVTIASSKENDPSTAEKEVMEVETTGAPEDNTTKDTSPESPKLDDSTLFKVPNIPERGTKIIRLCNWTFRYSLRDRGASRLFDNFGVTVEGFRKDMNADWKSSCIVRVKSARCLNSAATSYILEGAINTMLARQQGYPKEFVMRFLDGFPEDWHRLINDFYFAYIKDYAAQLAARRISPQLQVSTPPPPSRRIREVLLPPRVETPKEVQEAIQSKPQVGESSIPSGDKNADSDEHLDVDDDDGEDVEVTDVTERLGETDVAPVRVNDIGHLEPTKAPSPKAKRGRPKGRSPKEIKKRSSPIQSGRIEKRKNKKSPQMPKSRIPVPMKDASADDAVRRSRSGRVLKPPMASWAGQRILYNVRGSPVKAMGIITESNQSAAISNTSSIAYELGLSPPREPSQHERTLRTSTGSGGSGTKARRSLKASVSGKAGAPKRRSGAKARKLVDYSSSDDENSSSPSSDAESDASLESPKLTPIRRKNTLVPHSILSSPEEAEAKRERRKQLKKKKKKANKGREKTTNKGNKKAKPKVAAVSGAPHKGTKTKNSKEESKKAEAESQPSFSDVESEVSLTDFEDELEVERGEDGAAKKAHLSPPAVAQPPAPPKRWKDKEVHKLKVALDSIRPKEDSQWERVSKYVGGGRTVEECRAICERRHLWKPPEADKEQEKKEEMLKEMAGAVMKSKVGTVSYQVKAERFTRTYVMGTSRGGDFFDDPHPELNETPYGNVLSPVDDFEEDDALLSALQTPTSAEVRRKKRGNFIPKVVPLTPGSSVRRGNSRRSPSIDSATRDRNQRYVHQILKNNSFATQKMASTSAWVQENKEKRNFGSRFADLPPRTVDFGPNIDPEDDEDDEDDDDEDKDEYFDDENEDD